VNLKHYYVLLVMTQMKGKREFPPDVPSSGDVLSHLSESGILIFSLLLNIREITRFILSDLNRVKVMSDFCMYGCFLNLMTALNFLV